jgi:NAD(P)-dependent dehydrogenase (short-subunit alcohol dehydrogenase family)
MTKTWFITRAGGGLGAEIAKAALKAGDQVVAAGRNRAALQAALGPETRSCLLVDLDVTNALQAYAAIDAALERFGAIDVLVNNAGYAHLGFFEEMSLDHVDQQLSTNLFGAIHVCRAALPVMRAARTGRVLNIASLGGYVGGELSSLHCASKFALEGLSECLAKEVAPFGITVTIVEPGPIRTEFRPASSIKFNGTPIGDYDDPREKLHEGFTVRNSQRPGDPVKLAQALITLAGAETPPTRFVAGSLAMAAVSAKLDDMRADLKQWRSLSASTDFTN